MNMSQDPLIGGAMGYFRIPENYTWFKTFLVVELCVYLLSTLDTPFLILDVRCFQLPVFFIAMRGLLRGQLPFLANALASDHRLQTRRASMCYF